MPVNEWKHLKSVYLKMQNAIVREDFRSDIPDDDLSIPESSFRHACLLKPNDTSNMIELRLFLFYVIREKAKRLQVPMYAYPVEDYQESRVFKPQVLLEFWEFQSEARQNHRDIVRRRASFRLVDEQSETITQAKITSLSNRIKSAFPKSYIYKTGRLKCSYRDVSKGLELIVQPYSKAKGKDFVSKVLDAANVTPNWDNFTISTYPDRNFSQQQTIRILGENKKKKKSRPIANTYLRRATLHIHGRTESIILYESYIR